MSGIDAMRENIEELAGAFFSGQAATLGTLQDLAGQLQQAAGIDLFMVATPWCLMLPDDKKIIGDSYNLAAAAQEIEAHIRLLRETHADNAEAVLVIDEARLPELSQPERIGGHDSK